MNIIELIKQEHPTVTDSDFIDKIQVRDDLDDSGAYIAKWEYSEPMSKALESYKR
jgi:hypothetical protein